MTFRVRLSLAFAAAALLPLVGFGLGVRHEMTTRLDQQAAERVASLVAVLRADLRSEIRLTRERLRALDQSLEDDNRFRLAVAGGDRRWLLDWAGQAMRASGLDLLVLQDSAGRILSSGHFRNDYDRLDPDLPKILTWAADGAALVRVRAPEGTIRAMAGIDSFRVGGHPYTLVGGREVDSARISNLARDGEIAVTLVLGDSLCAPGAPCGPGEPVTEVALAYRDEVTPGQGPTARLVVTRDPGPAAALRRNVDRWWALAMGATLLIALGLGGWLAARLSRPIAALAERTARLDLDRLDQDFATDRPDEIGALSRLLDAMTGRLRASASRLREVERRAATGDLARQVNHDIKNGLAPIRHVVRHLSEVAERDPGQLPAIFAERKGTLESSVEYLDTLARNYARLSPVLDRSASHPNAILAEVARAVSGPGITVETRLAEAPPAVRADPVVMRRVLENLVSNAVEALDGRPGRIALATSLVGEAGERRVRITVSDTGRGMTRDELERVFEDFYTTKPAGTGLGLTVVRRLLVDLGGSVRVDTAPGQGSTFTVEIPVA
jgi:signal transduction histidine kinase